MRLVLSLGDITREDADAIVNAANSSLLGGGGVDGAIHDAGGPAILKACRRLRAEQFPSGLPTGQAVATEGGRLRARWVIHTVGPIYARDPDPPASLSACHVASLRVADDLGARVVAFPAISTGVFGYPVEEAAAVAIAAVRGAKTKVEEVRFVLFDHHTHAVFARAAR